MQKPHWSAWCRRNASCSGVSPDRAGERLDGRHGRPVDLHGEQAAAAHRDAVEEHGAGAADPVLASDVRPGQAEPVPEEVGQQQSRLHELPHGAAVDGQLDLDHRARSTARADERAGQRAEVAAEACVVDGGSTSVAASAPASAAASSPEEPTSSASTSARRVGRSVTAPTPTRASTMRPASRSEHDRGHRLREVAVPEGELLECARLSRPPRVARRVSTTSSPGRERREEVRDEEVRRRDLPSSAPTRGHDRSVEDDEAERQLRGAVRMGDRAAHGAAVPRDEVPDERQCLPHEWVDRARRSTSAAWRTVAPIRTSPFVAILAEAGVVDVDEHARSDEAHVQRRDEALAARDRLRVLPALGERRERLLERAARTYSNGGGFIRPPARSGPRRAAA